MKEESGCSQQLGQPTPAQPSQPEQPTRSQRRRALNFSEPGPPAPDTAAKQPGFMHSRVLYGEVRLHSCPDLIALQKACCVCFTCMLNSPTDAHDRASGRRHMWTKHSWQGRMRRPWARGHCRPQP